jgi:hypothetical protein
LAKPKLSTIGGPARFKPIAGTTMQYAANASSPLIYCKEMYYLCDTAAWFVASAPNGPWALCDAVPEEIYTIPPSCPIYAATYVQVYNSDADSVTFGFTAGYMNSYENDGTVAYGTGYTYPGSIGAQDLVLGNNSDITDDDTWDNYGGYPNTYGYWPSYGDDFGGWGFYGYPGWGDYGLYPGAYWSGDGWWGGGRGFGVGFALGMGFGDAWRWGYHPWGWRDGSGWWNNHWGGAYRRGWDNAARSYNRAGAAGDISRYGQIGPYRKTTAGANRAEDNAGRDDAAWHHAANSHDNVMTNRNGQVTQRRGDQMYTRADGAWQKSAGDGNRTNDGQAAAANGATGARKNQAAARTLDRGAMAPLVLVNATEAATSRSATIPRWHRHKLATPTQTDSAQTPTTTLMAARAVRSRAAKPTTPPVATAATMTTVLNKETAPPRAGPINAAAISMAAAGE